VRRRNGPLVHQPIEAASPAVSAASELPAAAAAPRARLALAAVFLLSILIRLPYAQLIPMYTDEVRLVKYAVRLTWGETVPLSLTGYNGPLMVYLLGAALAIWSAPETPRLLAVVLGSALPLLTAMIGLRRGPLLPALLAAGLLSTSFTYVVIYGHLPWAVTLGLLLLLLSWWLSLGPLGGRWPYLAGFCYGLALQCYPLLAAFAPWLLARHARALGASARRLAAYLAVLALALSPVALHHLLAWWREGSLSLGSSAPEILAESGTTTYGAGLVALARSVVDALSGAGHAQHFTIAQDPLALLIIGLATLAMVRALAVRDAFLVVNGLSFLLLAPLLVRQYGFPMGTRYSALLLPVLWLAVAAMTPRASGGRSLRSLRFAWTILLLGLMTAGGGRVTAFYREQVASGRTNAAMNALVDRAADACPRLVLDNRIDADYPAGGAFSRVVEARLNLQGIRPERADDAAGLAAAIAAQAAPGCAILSDGHLAELRRQIPAPDLRAAAGLPASEYGEGITLLWVGEPPPAGP